MAGITIKGDTSGEITLNVPATAGANTITIPASSGTLAVQDGSGDLAVTNDISAGGAITTTGNISTPSGTVTASSFSGDGSSLTGIAGGFSNMDVFTTPWWYLLGVETMNEQLNSTRLNRYTTIDRKQAAELRKYYEIMYMGGTIDGISYEGALNQATDTINIDCSDCCVECEGALKIMESTL